MKQSQKFIVSGGKKLYGKIEIDSAKNAILPILAASILCKGEVVLNNVTYYQDVLNMINILKHLGVSVETKEKTLIINSEGLNKFVVPEQQAKTLRASVFLLGPLLSRCKKARVAYPGGCAIGARPLDIHIAGLKKLGAEIVDRHGMITVDSANMTSGPVCLPFPSVGATENLIMSAVSLEGTTTLMGVAKEPEICDLCNFLNKTGAKIFGAGTDTIVIEGVKKLKGILYSPMPDRIMFGTYLFAPIMTGGEVEFCNVNASHIKPILQLIDNNGCKIRTVGDKIILNAVGRPYGMGKIETMPYPFFPTDLQQPFMSVASIAKGNTIIVENLFENRFNQVAELIKMGAKITVKDRTAIVEGVEKLYGASVTVPDLRGGAGLVLAGLAAEGYTTISGIDLIDRGYFKMEEKLSALGASIKRVLE